MCNNKNKHSGGVSCSACNTFIGFVMRQLICNLQESKRAYVIPAKVECLHKVYWRNGQVWKHCCVADSRGLNMAFLGFCFFHIFCNVWCDFLPFVCLCIWQHDTILSGATHTFEPRHEKICLRVSPTSQDTNQPAQPQKLARVLKFRL